MSGGRFNYIQYKIDDIIDDIENEIDCQLEFETRNKFKEAVATIRLACKMLKRIDWLLGGDDSEESFNRRWTEEITNKVEEVKKWK